MPAPVPVEIPSGGLNTAGQTPVGEDPIVDLIEKLTPSADKNTPTSVSALFRSKISIFNCVNIQSI